MIEAEASELLGTSSPEELATDAAHAAEPLSIEHKNSKTFELLSRFAICREILSQPGRVASYFTRLAETFGVRYVLSIVFVYGINQGVGESWNGVATNFYFSDPAPNGINLMETRAQKILGFASVPWQVKSVYGIVSDLVPIRGFKRGPYIFIAGVVGVIAWVSLWGFDLNVTFIGLFLFLGNFSVASPDVMIDASVAEKCRTHPEYASDLQTLCWGSMSAGAVLSSITAGILYENIGSRGLFLLTSTTSVVLLAPSSFNWLQETRVSSDSFNSQEDGLLRKFSIALKDPKQGPIVKLSLSFLLVSFALGMLAAADIDTLLLVFVTFLVTIVVTAMICYFEYQIAPVLAKASVYIFLSRAVQPGSVILSYWFRDVYPNCIPNEDGEIDVMPSPCFSPTYITNLNVVGYCGLLLGSVCYNRFFSLWPYQKIYRLTQLLLFLSGFLDLILVSRLNLALGIPDYLFGLGDEIVSDMVLRLNTMPLFVLAASVCPEGIEATLFAFNMGISNFGADLGSYYGMGLLYWLDLNHETGFKNLQTYVLIRTLFRLTPLLLIPYLLPTGTPKDSLLDEGLRSKAETEAHGTEEKPQRESENKKGFSRVPSSEEPASFSE